MNFMEIANARQSCRSYEAGREVEKEKLDAILQAARLAPSACNGQPYHFTAFRCSSVGRAVQQRQVLPYSSFHSSRLLKSKNCSSFIIALFTSGSSV